MWTSIHFWLMIDPFYMEKWYILMRIEDWSIFFVGVFHHYKINFDLDFENVQKIKWIRIDFSPIWPCHRRRPRMDQSSYPHVFSFAIKPCGMVFKLMLQPRSVIDWSRYHINIEFKYYSGVRLPVGHFIRFPHGEV